MWRPKVFVGSSSEGKKVAQTFCSALQPVAKMVPWWASPEFQPMQSTLAALLLACNAYDFGLFIMTPDDRIESRGRSQSSARDNVLFEMGLFLGKLGAERVFVFIQEGENSKAVKMPSDLAGVIIPRFSNLDRYDLIASVEAAAGEYGKLIQYRGPRFGRVKLVKSFGFDSSTSIFEMTLDAAKIKDNLSTLRDGKLVIVARKFDFKISPEDDRNIAIGKPRSIPKLGSENLILFVDGSKIFRRLSETDRIDAYLLLIPEGCNISRVTSISEMLDRGCDVFDRYGSGVGEVNRRRSRSRSRKENKG